MERPKSTRKIGSRIIGRHTTTDSEPAKSTSRNHVSLAHGGAFPFAGSTIQSGKSTSPVRTNSPHSMFSEESSTQIATPPIKLPMANTSTSVGFGPE